jgi:predicted flap endonuclease-1-like 5' DNA nuclease/predicted  nucleic acid-binding Zn-ribbon protein
VSELISKMLFCLFIASAIGFGMAWFLRRLSIMEAQDQVAAVKRDLRDRDQTIDKVRREYSDLESSFAARENQFETTKTQFTDLESKFSTVQSLHSQLETTTTKQRAELVGKEASLAGLTSIVAMRENALKERDASLATHANRIASLEKSNADQTELLRVRDETLSKRQARLEELEKVASSRSVDIDRLKGQVGQLQQQVESTSTVSEEVSQLKAQAANVGVMSAQVQKAEAYVREIQAVSGREKERLELALASANKTIEELRLSTNSSKPKMDQLAADLRSKSESFSALIREHDALSKTLDSRSKLLVTAQTAAAAVQTEYATLQKTHGDLVAQLNSLRTQLEQSKRGTIPPRQYSKPPINPDNIKHIFGVGPALESTLNNLGIYHFKQVALWTEADIDYFDKQLHEFHGRIRRENWVRSAVEEHYKKYAEWLGNGEPNIIMPETNRD